MSYEQVGKVMKKNKKQVENIVYRAKKALRKELEKEVSLYENK
jgi:RNA polymerase sigma-70 factor (ECF subfamily)